MNIRKILKNEFITGKTMLDWIMLGVGLVLQIAGIIVGFKAGTPESIGVIISGITGVISVVLCSQGKISFYVFGYIQLLTYVFCFAIPERLWGETIENVMYFISMFYGLFVWFKNYRQKDNGAIQIKAKKLHVKGWIISISTFVVGTLLYWVFLKKVPMFGEMDSQPFMDSITSVPAYIAQVLMVLGYREQWLYWLILDIGSVIMCYRAGSLVMTAQFIFWCVNCVYGYVLWTKSARYEDYRDIK